MAPEALLVAKPGDPHHHRVGELTLGEERQGCSFTTQLVLGVVKIGEELDLGDGSKPVLAQANGQTQYRLLIKQGVDDAIGSKAGHELLRHAIDPAFATHILSHQRGSRDAPASSQSGPS